jgi:hypothetical protein
MADLWGERCISADLLSFRGGLWEQSLRDSLIAGFRDAGWEEDSWVQPTDLQRWDHEIDILFRVGRLVVVGETKFVKYPCIPAEFGRFFQKTLYYGATQAALRSEALENNRKDLAKLCRYHGDSNSLIIRPLVISPQFLGSGLKINGVDTVSIDDLLHFFAHDRLPLGEFSAQGVNAVANLRFRKDGERVDDALFRYFKQPPQTFLYAHAVERVERQFVDAQAPETTISWREGVVKLPMDRAGFVAFTQSVEAAWNAKVLR